MDDETSDELSLDELAERSGVSSRTIRYYQSEGVLPAPRKDGPRRCATTPATSNGSSSSPTSRPAG